jgi:type I restriction enzyme S subunit
MKIRKYNRLGDYIQPVVGRNNELKDLPLMGLSINKVFIQSIANTIGTDMSTYRIIERNQFAYGPVTSRNGDKITIALFNDYEKALISQAYTPFEVIDTNELDPEYLMMWFRRPEFDRYARFKSHGSAREIFDWEEMCNTLLPVPDIDKQRKIVNEYNAIQNRITLNQQLIQKLEETAQTIYREWFVEFEFPDKKGKSYKSNGGEMVWNEELGKDIPEEWEVDCLSQIMEITSGKTPLNKNDLKDNFFKYPIYGAGGIMGYSSKFIFNERLLSMGRVGTHGVIQRINFPCWASDNTLVLISNFYEYVYQILLNINYDEINRGGVQGLITQTDIKNTRILIPSNKILIKFEKVVRKIMNFSELNASDIERTEELNDLLLSKLTTREN